MRDRRCPDKSNRLERMRDQFQKGRLIGREDFEATGFQRSEIARTLIILKKEYALDILVLCRGKSLIGWILADEIL